ncbi:bZIP transcription factor [Aspergillus affinis]|uniref:bZIP transcription factor n=1 Tax=Aspergillus affinis TaxID=1070780 RepID=UPI0022FDF15E|nr:uncharacterized protein KD926_001210 [Aspergillus affinis]KAI9036895.1 hypothetical protein KD926_001210 [Aspergillus affinis]
MGATRYNASASSSEKKRLRDRRAQQNMRQKKENLIKSLEDKVEFCERHHTGGSIQEYMETIESLRRENEALRDEIQSLKAVPSFLPDDSQFPTSSSITGPIQLFGDLDHPEKTHSSQETSSTQTSETSWDLAPIGPGEQGRLLGQVLSHLSNSSFLAPPLISDEALHFPRASFPDLAQTIPNSDPISCLVPISSYGDNAFLLPGHCPWLSYPELIAGCSPLPSPLDILHGTKHNFLADQINQRMRLRRVLDPECLGFGWLCYLFSKWRTTPNPTTFARLPPFMHPVVAQFQRGYPNALDLPVWPQLRRNLIKNWRRYDYFELVGYLSCCARVRWPFAEPILERDASDNLQIRQDFLDTVTRESGWGLASEFIEKYPELLEGMDVEAVRFRMDVL